MSDVYEREIISVMGRVRGVLPAVADDDGAVVTVTVGPPTVNVGATGVPVRYWTDVAISPEYDPPSGGLHSGIDVDEVGGSTFATGEQIVWVVPRDDLTRRISVNLRVERFLLGAWTHWADSTPLTILVPALPPVPTTVPQAYGLGPSTDELYAALGPLKEGDEGTGWQTMHLVAAIGERLATLDAWGRDSADRPGWTSLLDADEAPLEALPWLAQFVGVSRSDVALGETPDAQREMLRRHGGWGRGTPAALIAAAQRYMTGSKTVRLTERDGSAYSVTVEVYGSEVPSSSYLDVAAEFPTYADLDAAFPTYAAYPAGLGRIIGALAAAKPAGLVLQVRVLSGASYDDLGAEFATYDDLSAYFRTYDDMTIWIDLTGSSTYDELDAAFGVYDDMTAAYPTYTVLRAH